METVYWLSLVAMVIVGFTQIGYERDLRKLQATVNELLAMKLQATVKELLDIARDVVERENQE